MIGKERLCEVSRTDPLTFSIGDIQHFWRRSYNACADYVTDAEDRVHICDKLSGTPHECICGWCKKLLNSFISPPNFASVEEVV